MNPEDHPSAVRQCLIVNPHAGRQRASQRLERCRQLIAAETKVLETTCAGDARRLARRAVDEGFTEIVAAGGDGTVHEVACGILESDVRDVTLGVIPIGSANDFAWSLRREQPLEGRYAIDVGRIETNDGKVEHFVECIGVGLSGKVTAAARRIRWLQGMPLYALAALRAISRLTSDPLKLAIDGNSLEECTTLLSIMLGKREGNFVMAPNASMVDGQFDYVHAVNIRKWEALCLLPRLIVAGLPRHSKITQGRCKTLHVTSVSDLTIHADGEIVADEGDRVREICVRLLPRRLWVRVLA